MSVASLRYCIVCKRNRLFKYNHVLRHSECEDCGSRFAEPVRDKKTIEKIRVKIQNRIRELSGNTNITEMTKGKIKELNRVLTYLDEVK